jgi:hypothetical protein
MKAIKEFEMEAMNLRDTFNYFLKNIARETGDDYGIAAARMIAVLNEAVYDEVENIELEDWSCQAEYDSDSDRYY